MTPPPNPSDTIAEILMETVGKEGTALSLALYEVALPIFKPASSIATQFAALTFSAGIIGMMQSQLGASPEDFDKFIMGIAKSFEGMARDAFLHHRYPTPELQRRVAEKIEELARQKQEAQNGPV